MTRLTPFSRSRLTMACTASGEVVAGYRLPELPAGLMKTTSPRESQEKSLAASATRFTVVTTVFGPAPLATASRATDSVTPEKAGRIRGGRENPLTTIPGPLFIS